MGFSLNVFFISATLLLINSIKYILFGIGELDHTIFHFAQFVVVNNFLQINSEKTVNLASTFSLWAVFGLSPHDTSDRALDLILDDSSSLPHEIPPNATELFSGRRLQLNATTPENHLQQVVHWVRDNKFLLTLMILFGITLLSLIINWIYTLIRRKVIQRWCRQRCGKKVAISTKTTVTRSFSTQPIGSTNFTNRLVKILTLCYCNLCTITNSQMMKIGESSVAISFLAICTVIIFEIGFPIYIYRLLNSSTDKMFGETFARRYGSLYIHFKPKDSRFIIVILMKQMMYSVLININSDLTITQNSLLLATNLVFLVLIMKHSPYREELNYLQSMIMGWSTVIITLINYVFILDVTHANLRYIFNILNLVVHIGTFGSFIIIQGFRYCRRRRKPQTLIEREEANGRLIQLVVHNPILKEEDRYVLTTRRFQDQLHLASEASRSEVSPSEVSPSVGSDSGSWMEEEELENKSIPDDMLVSGDPIQNAETESPSSP